MPGVPMTKGAVLTLVLLSHDKLEMLMSEDGAPTLALPWEAVGISDESSHNGLYKNMFLSLKSKKKKYGRTSITIASETLEGNLWVSSVSSASSSHSFSVSTSLPSLSVL
jgi:hypothetical protein